MKSQRAVSGVARHTAIGEPLMPAQLLVASAQIDNREAFFIADCEKGSVAGECSSGGAASDCHELHASVGIPQPHGAVGAAAQLRLTGATHHDNTTVSVRRS
jgi:hypothetical protein